MSFEQFLNKQIGELRDQRAGLMKELDKRNEATKVWIQADTQTRAYANRLEKALQYLVDSQPHDGGLGACLYCDMGGAGYSTKGEGNHDDIKSMCPVVVANKALQSFDVPEVKSEKS